MFFHKVMVIRHAEKPEREGEIGLGPQGAEDDKSLTVQGWCRAGALARFFSPLEEAAARPGILRPDRIFAAGVGPGSKSKRPYYTVKPVADLLEFEINATYAHQDIEGLARAIAPTSGVTLVSWEHKVIPDLVRALTNGAIVAPDWPDGRYDMVLVLDRDANHWTISQVPQLLLAGDRPEPFS